MENQRSRGGESLFRFRLIARCLCVEDGRILLLRHFSHLSGREFWALPGGLVEGSETLAEAASRELREETGLFGTAAGIVLVQEFPGKGMVEIVFRFAGLQGQATLGTDPDLPEKMAPRLRDLRWVPLTELPPLQPAGFFRRLAQTGPKDLPEIPLPADLQFD